MSLYAIDEPKLFCLGGTHEAVAVQRFRDALDALTRVHRIDFVQSRAQAFDLFGTYEDIGRGTLKHLV